MDHLMLWFTIVLICCVSTRFSMCEFLHPEQTENMTDRTNCTLEFVDRNQMNLIKKYIYDGNRLIRFKLNILGDVGPLGGKNPDGLLKPDNWILSTDESGKSLLFLPEDYIQKSLWTLSFCEKNIEVTLRQMPVNCFGADNTNFTLQEIKNTIRYYLLRNFSFASDEVSKEFAVCNLQIITRADHVLADLKYVCCSEVYNMCETLENSAWMNILQKCLDLMCVFFPLFLPLLIPKSLYKKSIFLFRYSTDTITQPSFVLRIRKITRLDRDLDCHNDFIKLKENLKLPEFRNTLKDLPSGEHILNINAIYIKAHSEKLVECGTSPEAFTSFIWNYFGRCMMCRDDAYLKSCFSYCHSNMCLDFFRFALASILLFSPCWIAIVFFYTYDNEFYNEVEDAKDDLGLVIEVSNHVQDLIPGVFVTQGIFLVLFVSCLLGMRYCKRRISPESRFHLCIFHYIMSHSSNITLPENALRKVRKQFKWRCLLFPKWVFLKLLQLLVNTIPVFKFYWRALSFIQSLNKGEKYVIYTIFYCVHAAICLCLIFTFVASFYIEIFVFTITGIILNYDYVFKFVLLIFLILVYGNQSFCTNVSARYREYTESLIRYILEKNKDQMLANENDSNRDDKVNRENMQANKFFRQDNDKHDGFAYMTPNVNCTQQNFSIFLLQTANSEIQELIWKAPSLLLFNDISRNNFRSYISAEFFNQMKLLPKNFCPGVPTVLYLKALREFFLGVLLVSFWIVAIFALGRVQELSATVQTIVAVGTGLLPFGLKTFILKSKTTNLSKIERDSLWQIMFDKTAKRFNEPLIVSDIEVTTHDKAVPYSDGVNNIQSALGTNERPISIANDNGNITSNVDFVVIDRHNKCIIYVRRDIVIDSLYEETEYVDGYQQIV